MALREKEQMTDLKKRNVAFGYGVIKGTIVGVEHLTVLTAFVVANHSVYTIVNEHTLACTLLAMVPGVPVAISARKKKLVELRRENA
jgi:hypothetical protein